MGSIPTIHKIVHWRIMSFARREFDSSTHKSKTVYVVDVASRYTNSRTYGVAWFWLQYTSFTENSPNYNSKSYTTFSAADLELAA
jgi:hypothetical protein